MPVKPTRTWTNWAGTSRCRPAWLVRPRDDGEIVAAVRWASDRGLSVRAAGTGHSFNPLACTDGVLIDLSGDAGVLSLDRAAGTVTVRAGTSLQAVCVTLARFGLALENLGTLTAQTVAGAMSTGNHGTGLGHTPFSGQVVRLTLVTADGSVLTLDRDRDPEFFRCAATSLGALGVITTVTLRCVGGFRLEAREGSGAFDAFLDGFDAWTGSAEHVAMTWSPWRDHVSTRALDRTQRPVGERAVRRRYATTLAELRCGSIGLVSHAFPGVVPGLTGWTGRAARPNRPGPANAVHHVDDSRHMFAFPQPVRFVALEHALALEDVPEALRTLRGALRRTGRYSPYSVLLRVGKGDDVPLSPAYGRTTGYLNLTVPRSAAYLELLRVVEHVLREFGARPHWGKAHTATARILAPLYPEWELFQQVRRKLDPAGTFTNDYTGRLLGPAG